MASTKVPSPELAPLLDSSSFPNSTDSHPPPPHLHSYPHNTHMCAHQHALLHFCHITANPVILGFINTGKKPFQSKLHELSPLILFNFSISCSPSKRSIFAVPLLPAVAAYCAAPATMTQHAHLTLPCFSSASRSFSGDRSGSSHTSTPESHGMHVCSALHTGMARSSNYGKETCIFKLIRCAPKNYRKWP